MKNWVYKSLYNTGDFLKVLGFHVEDFGYTLQRWAVEYWVSHPDGRPVR